MIGSDSVETMGLLGDIRHRSRALIGPMLGVAVVGYFTYHVINGERGIATWIQLKDRVAEARQQQQAVAHTKELAERRVRLLRPDSLDPDLLEERARVILNYGQKRDLIVVERP